LDFCFQQASLVDCFLPIRLRHSWPVFKSDDFHLLVLNLSRHIKTIFTTKLSEFYDTNGILCYLFFALIDSLNGFIIVKPRICAKN